MSSWSQRSKRERILVYTFGAVALLAGARVMASGSGSEATTPEPAAGSALIVTPSEPAVTEDSAPTTYPGNRAKKWKYEPSRDPFKPLINVNGTSTGSVQTPQEPAVNVLKIDLIDIFVDGSKMVAMVDVNEKRHRGAVGKTLGGEVEVVELSDRCGVFEQGGSRFGLCVGQSIERKA